MLKIKDSVDLKKLRKYGFEYNVSTKNYERRIDNHWWDLIIIDGEDREIYNATEEIGRWVMCYSDDEFWEFREKYIEDLKKANLVEDVEEIE